MYPFSDNFAKYPCTVAVDFNPTAFPISLTDGAYPFSSTCFSINLNIAFSLLLIDIGSFFLAKITSLLILSLALVNISSFSYSFI